MQRKTAKKTAADFTGCACSGANLPKLVQPSILAALCYGAGHALPLFVVCAVWAAGMSLERLRFFGRCVSVAAGFGLVIAGAVSALAGF